MEKRAFALALILAACGGKTAPAAEEAAASAKESVDQHVSFGPLEVGADYASYTKVNKESFLSEDHGERFVDVYVNSVGLEAYKDEDTAMPVGSVVVKTSWENVDGKASEVAGPTFVMEKRAAGFDPEHNDWWYALHWEKVPEKWVGRMGSQVYLRTPSSKVKYCWECHENYEDEIGLPPEEARAY